MGVLTVVNAALIGAFAFASVHHLFLWRLTRTRLPLLIAVYCGVSALLTVSIVGLDRAATVDAAQRALDARVTLGLLGVLALAWLVSSLTDVRPRAYLLGVSILLGTGVAIKVLGFPISGYVTGLSRVTLPWGEEYQVLERATSAVAPGLVLYAAVLSVYAFTAIAGWHWSRRDRLAGVITMSAGVFGVFGAIVGLLIDLAVIRAPYVGQVPNAMWILLATILVTREHAAREHRLEESEARIAVSEARYRTLIESAPEAIVVFDLEAKLFADVNPEACRLFGATAEQLTHSNPVALSAPVQPDGRSSAEAAAAYLERAARGETPVFDWTHRTVAGQDVPCEVRLVRMPDPTRVLVRGSITDISGRRQLEDQLRQSQKMEAIGQLAGGVAHDFNNLLTVISGYAEILRSQLPAPDPRHALVKAIGDTAERAGWLTARLLAFGRRAVLSPQVFDLNALVGDGEHILRRLIGEHIAMRVDRSQQPLHVTIDPGQWSQLMLNLAINARDAMPAGGVLQLRTFTHHADDRSGERPLAPGAYAAFSVSDTGLGMTPEVRGRIFEPFFTTKESGRGTGLGLAVVHGIVAQAGGGIEVETVPGRGTTFTVYLPLSAEATVAPAAAAPGNAIGDGELVLVVEDEAVLRELLEAALSARGYRVLSAADGEDALRVIDEHGLDVDLLVTDMVMPGRLNGRALADVVRQRLPRVKVLFISGYIDDPSLRAAGFGSGEHWLQKPFSLGTIASKAREILDQPSPAAD